MECLHGNWTQSRTTPPRFGEFGKKEKVSEPELQNQKNQTQTTPKELQIFFKKSKQSFSIKIKKLIFKKN